MNIINHEDIRRVAPAAFATEPSPKMSGKYGFINTMDALFVLEEAGFSPVSAKQDKAKSRDSRYVRHAIVLRPTDTIDAPHTVGETVPQILLINSHNGRTQLSIRAGLYRFVCANGMVVGRDLTAEKVRHTGNIAAEINERLKAIGATQNKVSALIENWKSIELSDSKANDFAMAAAKLRFGAERALAFKPEDILATRRPEDEGRSLWAVFNRVQENTTQGGLSGLTALGRPATSRALTGIGENTMYNEVLWDMASELVVQ